MANQGTYDCILYDYKSNKFIIKKEIIFYNGNDNLSKLIDNVNKNVYIGIRLIIDRVIYEFANNNLYISPIVGINLGVNFTPALRGFKYNQNLFLSYIGFGEFDCKKVNTEFVLDRLSKKKDNFRYKYGNLYRLRYKDSISLQSLNNLVEDKEYRNKLYICRCMKYNIDIRGEQKYNSRYFDDIVKNINGTPINNVGAIEIEIDNSIVNNEIGWNEIYDGRNVDDIIKNPKKFKEIQEVVLKSILQSIIESEINEPIKNKARKMLKGIE